MITMVNSINTGGSYKKPQRKSQCPQLGNSSVIPHKSGYNDHFSKQKSNAMVTSTSIVAGSVLFTMLYFLFSAMSLNMKRAI